MEWVDVIGAFGIPAILGAIIPFLIMRYYNKKDEKEEDDSNREDKIQEFDKKQKETEERLETIEKLLLILKNAEQALLRDRIIQCYNHYYKEKKFMPIYARESLDHMYKEYRNLDGNGIIEDLIKKLYQLPTEPDDYLDDSDI